MATVLLILQVVEEGKKNVDKSCHFVSQTYLGGYMEWKIVKIFQSVLKLFLLIQL